jgi:hypothetical protein
VNPGFNEQQSGFDCDVVVLTINQQRSAPPFENGVIFKVDASPAILNLHDIPLPTRVYPLDRKSGPAVAAFARNHRQI